jgi:REP element-mobilizing transposase RayT
MQVLPRRKSLRLRQYDYSQAGAYFVTICTHDRRHLLGRIEGGKIQVNACGQIIRTVWENLAIKFKDIGLDAFVVMPNHIHGIIIVGAQFIAPTVGVMNHAPTLGDIVRSFKAISTRLIRKNHNKGFNWQRNYYEHVIRDETSLNRIREYILTNPLRWDLDRENPQAREKDNFDVWLNSFKEGPREKTG